MLASEAILHSVNGTGSGFEIDDLMSWSPTDEQEARAIEPLTRIAERYRTPESPVGISNPAAEADLRSLAAALASQGL
jgi:hypothetical protein